jgi:hypothetical protein
VGRFLGSCGEKAGNGARCLGFAIGDATTEMGVRGSQAGPMLSSSGMEYEAGDALLAELSQSFPSADVSTLQVRDTF